MREELNIYVSIYTYEYASLLSYSHTFKILDIFCLDIMITILGVKFLFWCLEIGSNLSQVGQELAEMEGKFEVLIPDLCVSATHFTWY